jgi:hypothetical protein
MAESLTTVGEALASGRINLEEPRWDQSSYSGRAKHFFTTTNPLNVFASSADLDWAKDVVTKYRKVTFKMFRRWQYLFPEMKLCAEKKQKMSRLESALPFSPSIYIQVFSS